MIQHLKGKLNSFRRTKPAHQREGQALIEFALILPILLLFIAGIFDFGRAMFTYAQASQAHRNTLRQAEIVGYAGGGTKPYLDCTKMRAAASNFYFTNPKTVTLKYLDVSNPDASTESGFAELTCNATGDVTDAQLENGDILFVQINGTIDMVLFPLSLDFNFEGMSTIVKSIALTNDPEFDLDADGLLDSWETNYFGNITSQNALDDPDGDGCNNGIEEIMGTNPTRVDTDADGLGDCDEANGTHGYVTDPLEPDTDQDHLNDGEETFTYTTDPTQSDTDGDGLIDGGYSETTLCTNPTAPREVIGEVNNVTTDPLVIDTDSDGLTDHEEACIPFTDPVDGMDYFSDPNVVDTDGDTLGDGLEVNGVPATNPTKVDTDGDGLSDDVEQSLGTDPTNEDTDGDGSLDGADGDPLDPGIL